VATPAGKQQVFLVGRVIAVPSEDPAGSGFLPRKLRRCPRKASTCSEYQLLNILILHRKTEHKLNRTRDTVTYSDLLL